jgi:hypothetical protein
MLRGPTTAIVLLGSANFTRKGLGLVANPGAANIEACVLLRLPAASVLPEAWMPPAAERGIVDWALCEEGQVKTPPPEEDPPLPWPDFIYRMELTISWVQGPDREGLLRIVQAPVAHPDFTISLPPEGSESSSPPLTSFSAADAGPVPPLPLDAHAVRRVLTCRTVLVTWNSPPQSVRFPVNIDEESKAALPSVLGARPDEQQLLAYFHGRITEEDLVEHLERQAQQLGEGQHALTAQEAERLKQFQNYLLRDFVESLFGMEETLRQAMRSPRAFKQALVGDFSPGCLAEQVLQAFRSGRRSATAAAYQLVELIRVVASLDLPDQSLMPSEEREALEEVRARGIQRLLQTAAQAGSRPDFQDACNDTDFASYVRTCLPRPIADAWTDVGFKTRAAAHTTHTTTALSMP